MTLPRGWRLGVLVATLLTLATELVYVYAVRFQQLVHSDVAIIVILARSTLASHAIIPPHWYWMNGDVWFLLEPLALPLTALMGVGIHTLETFNLVTFAIELGVLGWCFRQLGVRRWVAVLAAAATLLGISRLHFQFVFIEVTYGLLATMYFVVFVQLARLLPVEGELVPRRRWAWAALLLVVVAAGNPTRFFAFGLLPLLVPAVWPWRGVGVRFRAAYAGLVVGAHLVAAGIFRFVFLKLLTFTPIASHDGFRIRDAAGIRANLALLGRGLLQLTGDPEPRLASLPGIVLVAGAAGTVVAHALGRRDLTRTRFLGLVLACVGGAVLVPLVAANFMNEAQSVRYLMPAVMPMLGLTVVLLAERTSRLARAWLVLLPFVGLLGFVHMIDVSVAMPSGQWSNRPGHPALAAELAKRGLRRGFASYWNANIVTLLSRDAVEVCPVLLGDTGFVPYRWAIDASCFDRRTLPPEVFFLASAEERAQLDRATETAFGPPRERFDIDGFEVRTYSTASLPLGWLDLPLPGGDAVRFPLVLPATHAAMRSEKDVGAPAPDGIRATGKSGVALFGPVIELPKGHYRVTWLGSGIPSDGSILFDVYAPTTSTVVRTRMPSSDLVAVQDGVLASLELTLEAATPEVELRVLSEDGGQVLVRELRLERE